MAESSKVYRTHDQEFAAGVMELIALSPTGCVRVVLVGPEDTMSVLYHARQGRAAAVLMVRSMTRTLDDYAARADDDLPECVICGQRFRMPMIVGLILPDVATVAEMTSAVAFGVCDGCAKRHDHIDLRARITRALAEVLPLNDRPIPEPTHPDGGRA